MRIASLVPSATECLFELGLGASVVAVTHECDWPERARRLPRLTRSMIPGGLPPGAVDRAVRERTERGEAIYGLDERLLAELEPELIVTQEVCPVCAVSYDEVCSIAAELPGAPRVMSLDPERLTDVLDDLPRLAAACGVPVAGARLRADLAARLDRVRARGADAGPRPRVLALEWLDPPYVAGHWVPEMITLAGGSDTRGAAGGRSAAASWDELRTARPDVVVVMPCGLDARAAAGQAAAQRERLAALGAERIVAVDAKASFSRPGPRLVDGVELLAHLLRPERAPAPAGLTWRAVAQI